MAEPELLLVTTIVRNAALGVPSGFIRLVDLRSGEQLASWPMHDSEMRAHDPNPRGGLRGGRGISSYGERLCIANTDRVFVYRPGWKLETTLSHPFMGQVHDILAEADGVWITCSSSDVVIKLGWDGALVETWDWRADPVLRTALGHDPPPLDRDADYRDPRRVPPLFDVLHLNAITRGPDGLIISLGFVLSPLALARQRERLQGLGTAIDHYRQFRLRFLAASIFPARHVAVQVSPSAPTKILAQQDAILVPNHNLVWRGDSLVYNDTNGGAVVVVAAGREVARIHVPGTSPAQVAALRRSGEKADVASSFLRGMEMLGPTSLVVGNQSPLALHVVDLVSHAVARTIVLPGLDAECVYGLHRAPPGFTAPSS